MSNTNIYILKLRDGYYYIGRSNNVEKRLKQHLKGIGSNWTKKYKPINIEKVIPNCSPWDEDRYVKEYMGIYGIDKVRGGSYTNINLDDNQIELLTKEIRNANNQCLKCGSDKHYMKNCKRQIVSLDIIDSDESEENIKIKSKECEYCNIEFLDDKLYECHINNCKKNNICYFCGIKGHYSKECYTDDELKKIYKNTLDNLVENYLYL